MGLYNISTLSQKSGLDRDRPQIRHLVLPVSNPAYWPNNPVRELDEPVSPFAILWALDFGHKSTIWESAFPTLQQSDKDFPMTAEVIRRNLLGTLKEPTMTGDGSRAVLERRMIAQIGDDMA